MSVRTSTRFRSQTKLSRIFTAFRFNSDIGSSDIGFRTMSLKSNHLLLFLQREFLIQGHIFYYYYLFRRSVLWGLKANWTDTPTHTHTHTWLRCGRDTVYKLRTKESQTFAWWGCDIEAVISYLAIVCANVFTVQCVQRSWNCESMKIIQFTLSPRSQWHDEFIFSSDSILSRFFNLR